MRVNNCCSNRVQNNKNPNFKARICFVNREQFQRLLKKLPKHFRVGENWIMEEAAVRRPLMSTERAYDCTAGVIVNPQTGLGNMFHLAPDNFLMSNGIGKTLFRQAQELKRGAPDVQLEGLLLGADVKAPFHRNIVQTFRRISTELGMDFSEITGRRNGQTGIRVITDARHNIHYIDAGNPSLSPIELGNIADIQALYHKVRIAPTDTVAFPRRNVKPEINFIQNFIALLQRTLLSTS